MRMKYTRATMRNNPPRSEPNVSQWATIDLNRLRVFAQVVDKRSFTAAAAALKLPKSSVSKSVRALEESLGVQLVQRNSRSVRATDAGSTLFENIRPAMAVITESVSATATRGSDPRGRVRVSCPPDFDELLAPYVARFCHDHPGIAVEISLSARNVDLIADGYDLALRGGDLHDSGYVVRGTVRSAFALFAAPTYLRTRKTPRRVSDLAEHVCIGVHPVGGRDVGAQQRRKNQTRECDLSDDDGRHATRFAPRHRRRRDRVVASDNSGNLRHGRSARASATQDQHAQREPAHHHPEPHPRAARRPSVQREAPRRARATVTLSKTRLPAYTHTSANVNARRAGGHRQSHFVEAVQCFVNIH
jgi:DNA-binding transcriptional LysR family regulator